MAEGTLGGTKIADLPRSSFAYCEPNGGACHFPIRDANGKADAAHVRNALARPSGSPFEAKARPKVEAAARELGIGAPAGKAPVDMKAQLLDNDEQAAWFAGRIPRRLLAIPFGGPIPRPGAPRGVDYDNEFFSEHTDIFGGIRALTETRDRLTDFSHAFAPPDHRYGDPGQIMSGHIIGKSVLDPNPDEDGWWVDFWFKAGDKRVRMIEALASRGRQLFGSTQPVAGKAQRNNNGEITVWPYLLQTLTPAPSNTLSAFLPAKAVLEEADMAGIAISAQMRTLLAEMRDLDADLRRSSLTGDDGAKAGRELSSANADEIEAAIGEMHAANTRIANMLERIRSKYRKQPAEPPEAQPEGATT